MFLSQGQRRNNSREEEPRLKSGLGHPDLLVRGEAVNAMLLNEFLKEHRNVAEQQSTIAELNMTVAQQQQKQMEALTATVRKVSERVELSAPALQIAANDD
jgi:uncharacterized coiled-coil protein SlyX